jgi:hypothetical protein
LTLCSDLDVSSSARSLRSSTSAIATQGTQIELDRGRLSHVVAWSRGTPRGCVKKEPTASSRGHNNLDCRALSCRRVPFGVVFRRIRGDEVDDTKPSTENTRSNCCLGRLVVKSGTLSVPLVSQSYENCLGSEASSSAGVYHGVSYLSLSTTLTPYNSIQHSKMTGLPSSW